MKKVLILVITILMGVSICACADSSAKVEEKIKTEEDIVLEEVELIGKFEYKNWKINDNELKSSSIDVTTLEKDDKGIYTAYGKLTFVDVFGDTDVRNVTIEMEYFDGVKQWKLKSIDIEGFEYEMLYH